MQIDVRNSRGWPEADLYENVNSLTPYNLAAVALGILQHGKTTTRVNYYVKFHESTSNR